LALAALGRGEAMTRQTLAPIRRALSPSTHFALMLVLALVTALSAVALGHDLIASTERGVRRPPHGRLEVTIAGPCAAGEQQVFPGNLRLRSLDERVEAVISGFEIAVGAASRRELPAGTYALTWSMDPLAPAQWAAWNLRGSGLVSVFDGETTRLEVRRTGEVCTGESS
jgi:hypothetical protein